MTYLYLCKDGMYRNRCQKHMQAGKGTRYGISPHFPKDKIKRSTAQCPECTWQKGG